ncbi:UDP-N-acetylglucosamine--N-acetylmuramyl-(pentapeptide) pyrophosphoryl-undecaprenol N-acetylglucosamine transferase [bacterium]|nr:UDP-N-acetylglucosamine--N-acetylmuramyl-(pentapeptide) pyrophosphoryl-undecaprenol N-acetylglucosamine transferase [bacterium]
MSEPPLVVIAAGGTGGHMFPAQAFADEMRSRGWSIGLVTDARGEVYAKSFPADWKDLVEAATFSSKLPHKLIGAALKLRRGAAAARKRFAKHRPALVAGFGGYPSYPALSAAAATGAPFLIHEQNAVLGRVNRLFAGRAKVVACGFYRLDGLAPSAAERKRVVGNPVRGPIRALRDAPWPDPGGGPINLLVTGGSQGAKLFGEVIPAAIGKLPEALRHRLSVAQQAREGQLEDVSAIYRGLGVAADVQPFFPDMAQRLAATHLVVARSGASTVTELAVVGRASILVPLAIAMDDHQTANAEGVAAADAADVIAEAAFNPDSLAKCLQARLSAPDELKARGRAAWALGRPDAAERLADLAEQAAGVK